jgi:hypothetical protein
MAQAAGELHGFGRQFEADTAAWLRAVSGPVRAGGRLAVVIGDGVGVDARAAVEAAACVIICLNL